MKLLNVSNRTANSLGMPVLIATVCLIGTACWLLAKGDNLPGKPKAADKPMLAENVVDFAALFATNCAGCHGIDGKLGSAPPLNDSLFRAIVSQQALEEVVSEGRPGTPMPGFSRSHGGTLTDTQIQVLVNQIKGVAYKIVASSSNGRDETKVVEDSGGIGPVWGRVEPAPFDVPAYEASTRQPSRTSKDFEAIRTTLFARACADCHGDHGEGSESYGAINDRDFLALASDQVFRRVIITGLPGLGMPDYKSADQRASDFKPLTSAEVDDLVALLAYWRLGNALDTK